MEEQQLCEHSMHKYPVIHISLKDINADNKKNNSNNLQSALDSLKNMVGTVALRFRFLIESEALDEYDKLLHQQLVNVSRKEDKPMFIMRNDILKTSLATLATLIKKHFGIGSVLLIDEYDVPLNNAFNKGYYDDFVDIYRAFLCNSLKDSKDISFAVVTGCLKISNESIFTGLSKLYVMDVASADMDEYFGLMTKRSKIYLSTMI